MATDGVDDTLGPNDGVWVVDTEGPERGRARQFLSGPVGCEVCGPAFTPDNRTFFVAIQHPWRRRQGDLRQASEPLAGRTVPTCHPGRAWSRSTAKTGARSVPERTAVRTHWARMAGSPSTHGGSHCAAGHSRAGRPFLQTRRSPHHGTQESATTHGRPPRARQGGASQQALRLTKAWSRRAVSRARLMPGVCAVHAVMLGGESPLSRYAWSRRTREAQGRHREVGSEGSVERRCGARDTNRIRGVVQSGRAGTRPQSPPSTIGLCFINPASMHGRYDSLPREICGVSWHRTEGGAILPDRPAEVSRGHSRPGAGEAREAPQGRKAGQQIGRAATRVGRRPERWRGVVAWRGAARWHPARCRASARHLG